jgi:hypothetical protein
MDMITGSSVLTTGFCLSSWSNWSTVCISKASGWRYRSCFLASQFRREEEGEEGQRSQKLRETKRLINANHIHIQEDLRWSNQFLSIFHDVSVVFFWHAWSTKQTTFSDAQSSQGSEVSRTRAQPPLHMSGPWLGLGLAERFLGHRGVGIFNGQKLWDFLEKPDQLTWYNLIWYIG